MLSTDSVFDDIAGQKFERDLSGGFRSELRERIAVKNKIKDERENDPDDAPNGRFFERNNVRFAIENAQIEREHY